MLFLGLEAPSNKGDWEIGRYQNMESLKSMEVSAGKIHGPLDVAVERLGLPQCIVKILTRQVVSVEQNPSCMAHAEMF